MSVRKQQCSTIGPVFSGMDPATALVILVSSFTAPEFGMNFYHKKSGLVVEYTYFLAKDAVSCMITLFGISESEALHIGGLLLECGLVKRANFSAFSGFVADDTKMLLLKQSSNLDNDTIIQTLATALNLLLENLDIKVTRAFIEDVQFILELDGPQIKRHAKIKSMALSKLNTANSGGKPVKAQKSLKAKEVKEANRKSEKSAAKEKSNAAKEKSKEKVSKSKKTPTIDKRQVSMPNVDLQSSLNFEVDSDDIKYAQMEDPNDPFPIVKAASIDKLIERLTHEVYPDIHFRTTFMLTYRSFMEPRQLLQKLDARFKSHGEAAKTIQLRVVGVVKMWIENYSDDFISDTALNMELLEFIDQLGSVMDSASHQLKKSLLKQQESHRKSISLGSDTSNEPVSFDWADVDELEVAQQICVYEFKIYSAISPKETLNLNWSKDKERSPNVLALIEQFNSASRWVQLNIVRPVKLADRVKALVKFINLCQKLFELNNYNAVNEVISGINSSPVRRLKKTWAELGISSIQKLEYLETVMSHEGSYKEYREFLHHCDPPTIPYLGTYLTDLTFIEDGNMDFDGHLVNFDKRYKTAAVIGEIQQYQKIGYNSFTPNPQMQRWLAELEFVGEEEAYSISLKVEPRNPNEAVENMLMDEQKLREEIKALQVRNADLEKSNQHFKTLLNNATRDMNRMRGGNKPRGRGGSVPKGRGNFVGPRGGKQSPSPIRALRSATTQSPSSRRPSPQKRRKETSPEQRKLTTSRARSTTDLLGSARIAWTKTKPS